MRDASSFLPLSPLDFQVLLLLTDGPLHGYGIVKASDIELGSLYRIINRLTQQGLIEEVAIRQPDTRRKRRHYRTTRLGHAVAQSEALRLRALLDSRPGARLLRQR